MMTPRLFVGAEPQALTPGTDYALPGNAVRHAARVLRMRTGDALTLFTGAGGEYAATILRADRRAVTVRIERHDAVERESAWAVTLVQSLIAADLMDWIVRKAVELGVHAIAPVQAARSQAVPGERAARRAEHWRQVAIAACEQCGRNRVPTILPSMSLAAWTASARDVAQAAILDASAQRSLASHAAAAPPPVVVVGPEGGFTPEEVRSACARGATAVHMGRRVLRAETAALAALATIGSIAGDAR
jgi:16S rRNA (uracil1498-N3)-methyltransferase